MPGTSKKISDLNAIATMHDTDLVEVSNDNQDSTYTSVKATIGDVAEHVAITTEFTNDLDTTDKTLVGAINEVAGDIPTVNNATLTIQKNSTTVNTFTANASSDVTVDISVPTTVAELTDASDYATVASLATVATTGSYNSLTDKPTIPAAQVNADWDAVSGVAQILNKPTIPAAQVNSDWSSNSGVSQILNKPTLATVATSGSYNDLSSKPTIPDSLSGLTGDVNISSPTDGQVLKYDNATSKWVNGTGGGGGSSTLAGLQDVTITSPTSGQVLYFDGDEWINHEGGGAVPYTQEVLWDYVSDNSGTIPFDMYNKTLHQSIDNYDELIVEFISSSSDVGSATWDVTYQWIVDVSDLKSAYVNNNLAYNSYGTRASRFYISGTTFQKVGGDTSTHGLVRVVGVKFGTGGGSSWTDLTDTLLAGQITLTIQDVAITVNSTIDVYTDTFGISPTNQVVTAGQIVLTFEAQANDLGVKVRVS